MYYQRMGKRATAEFFVKKVLRQWPDSRWAIEAKRALQADLKPADRTDAGSFNFRVCGFY
jgi:hypothetical protein